HCRVGPAHVHPSFLHSLHYDFYGRRADGIDNGVDFWRGAASGPGVTSPAIKAVNIRTVKGHASRFKARRKLLLPDCGILTGHRSRWPRVPGFAHAGVAEFLMEMANPAFAGDRRNWNVFAPARLSQQRWQEGENHHQAFHRRDELPGSSR